MDKRNPVCRPLLELDEVLAWQPGNDVLCVASVSKRERKEQDVPRVLVCHDMRGGYLEDRLVQGCGRPNSYRFYQWQYVDTFVYFSHYFVTIPPAVWTNAAHRHGVNVLGTVITEWDDGKKRCEKFLESEASYKQFADQLVKISKYYGFDGWLINIENVIESEEHVERLRGFVDYLTREQHHHSPGSLVIWYDSVVSTGKLDWQNALNQHNKLFFDACDGIFLNYCWKEEHLVASKTCAIECKRPYDVYVGIDVFGRGCLGDGGYNTKEAMAAVRKHDLSAAIFAQGWVYEKHGAEQFTQNENKFWELLAPFCHPCVYTTLPLNTTFCQGFGERFFDQGMPVGNPWWNLNVQQLQPMFAPAQLSADDKLISHGIGSAEDRTQTSLPQMDLCTEDSFIGGASLKLEADVVHSQFVKYSLFTLDVDLKQHSTVYVSVTYKILQDPDCDIFLELHLQHDDQNIVLVMLPFPDGDKPVPTYDKNTACMYVHCLDQADLPKLVSLASPVQSNTRWKTRWFKVYSLYLKFCRLTMVKVGLTTTDPQPKTCIALLGDLKILPSESLPETFPRVEFRSVESDNSSSYPLLDMCKNNFTNSNNEDDQPPQAVEWGVDAYGNKISIPYQELDKMRVSCHTLREFRPGLGGQLCEVLYQLITSLDCFTLSWKPDKPEFIDHYRVYQIKIDSGVAKLLGHVTEPYFKVTWFEIPDYEKDEVKHHFKFVVRPVMKNGLAVPLDYNFCKLYHIASVKDKASLVTDSSTETQSSSSETNTAKEDEQNCVEADKSSCSDGNCIEETKTESKDCQKLQDGIENMTQKLQISDE